MKNKRMLNRSGIWAKLTERDRKTGTIFQKGLPMKAMPFFKRSSGSLGFSEA